MSRINEIWVCAKCHNVFRGDENWEKGGYCTKCAKSIKDAPTESNFENWGRYLIQIRDKEWSYDQLHCKGHNFQKVPRSGMYLGIPLWRCIHCEAVTEAS